MTDSQQDEAHDAVVQEQAGYTIKRRDRHWEARDPTGELVCVAVYKRGAIEVVRRLTLPQAASIQLEPAPL